MMPQCIFTGKSQSGLGIIDGGYSDSWKFKGQRNGNNPGTRSDFNNGPGSLGIFITPNNGGTDKKFGFKPRNQCASVSGKDSTEKFNCPVLVLNRSGHLLGAGLFGSASGGF